MRRWSKVSYSSNVRHTAPVIDCRVKALRSFVVLSTILACAGDMTSVVFNPDNLAHVIAALQHYRMSLLAARTEKPFDFSLLASLGQNDAAMMAVRTALNDFRPNVASTAKEIRTLQNIP